MVAADGKRTRPKAGEALAAVGRARRYWSALDTGAPVELWCFEEADRALVKRLVSFGEQGVFGFCAGWGEDDEGIFALRCVPSKTVDALGKGERLDGLTALA
ncbi:MAG TPA: hypothetical protein VM580_29360, partial [Labilithrix sp.]|nr:hypothetical protein [Labilithrix sp.]